MWVPGRARRTDGIGAFCRAKQNVKG